MGPVNGDFLEISNPFNRNKKPYLTQPFWIMKYWQVLSDEQMSKEWPFSRS